MNQFTRPRRFGKTLNMSMLKEFFEIGSDKVIFDGLEISKETKLCEEYMGQFPVVSITLKNVAGLNYREACNLFRRVIGAEVRRFSFLAESDKLDDGDRRMYQALTDIRVGSFTMTDDMLIDSLRMLWQSTTGKRRFC